MDEYKDYLKQEGYKDSTIEEHCRSIQWFKAWMKHENIDETLLRYNDLLAYIQYEKERNIDAATVNLRLTSISRYFDFLKRQGMIEKNLARTIRVKGIVSKVIKDPLTAEELEALYKQYSSIQKLSHVQDKTDLAHKRNTIILGLMVYQGVHGGELKKMEVSHIDLRAGSAYIPSTNKSNSRQLALSSAQILPLNEYLTGIRDQLKPKGDELIPGSIRNIIVELAQELQGINPIIQNALHIRGSVILNWLKQHNKREVQYMAGHKYISSTEKYAVQEIELLTDELSKHHPFG